MSRCLILATTRVFDNYFIIEPKKNATDGHAHVDTWPFINTFYHSDEHGIFLSLEFFANGCPFSYHDHPFISEKFTYHHGHLASSSGLWNFNEFQICNVKRRSMKAYMLVWGRIYSFNPFLVNRDKIANFHSFGVELQLCKLKRLKCNSKFG